MAAANDMAARLSFAEIARQIGRPRCTCLSNWK